MAKLSTLTASKAHRALIFGPPKVGKTRLVGGLAKAFNIILIDLEKGHDTLFQLPLEYQERIEVISLPDTRVYPIGIETCLKLIRGQKGKICEAHGKWNCMLCAKDPEAVQIELELNALPLDTIVVIDSVTQLVNSAIAHITKAQPDDYKLGYDDWAHLGKLMDTFLSQVQQAGFHVICISHETETEMEDGKMKLVPTAGTRAFSRNSAKYFDEVIYCEVKNKKHIAASSTIYSGTILTGSRSGTVLEEAADPVDALIALFKGEKPAKSIVNTNTPAQKAVSSLGGIAARLAAAKAQTGTE